MEIAKTIFKNGTVAKLCSTDEAPEIVLLLLNDQLHSAVNTSREDFMFFDYHSKIAEYLDKYFPQGSAIKALTLGGGAYSIPRYIEATRPGSDQKVVEIDKELVDFVAKALPLKTSINVVCSDAYDYILNVDKNIKYDFLLFDAYVEPVLEDRFISFEFVKNLQSLVEDEGIVALNIIDDFESKKLIRQLKNILTLGAKFVEIYVLHPGTPQGESTGNKNVVVIYRKK